MANEIAACDFCRSQNAVAIYIDAVTQKSTARDTVAACRLVNRRNHTGISHLARRSRWSRRTDTSRRSLGTAGTRHALWARRSSQSTRSDGALWSLRSRPSRQTLRPDVTAIALFTSRSLRSPVSRRTRKTGRSDWASLAGLTLSTLWTLRADCPRKTHWTGWTWVSAIALFTSISLGSDCAGQPLGALQPLRANGPGIAVGTFWTGRPHQPEVSALTFGPLRSPWAHHAHRTQFPGRTSLSLGSHRSALSGISLQPARALRAQGSHRTGLPLRSSRALGP